MKTIYKPVYIILVCFCLLILIAGCTPRLITIDDFYHSQINYHSQPYKFDYISWEVNNFAEVIWSRSDPTKIDEAKIKEQIIKVLRDNDIEVFPPLKFKISRPPNLLVVSLRERIVYYYRVLLTPDMTIRQKEELEDKIDSIGLSALVISLGGFGGTYPAIISSNMKFSDMVETIIEEWFHQYLIFKPLGFLYLLDCFGLKQDENIITLNETFVGIVSQELAAQILNQYYRDYSKESDAESHLKSFDFDTEMRRTRKQVDLLLAVGDVLGAENYMELRRQMFVQNGYNIRKLNQAYFAFHSIYGQDPASISPIHAELQKIRDGCVSLNEFVYKVSQVMTYEQLKLLLVSSSVN